MNTKVWCDRTPYEVRESRTDVLTAIENVRGTGQRFIYVTPQKGGLMFGGEQICLNIDFISAVWALPGRGV